MQILYKDIYDTSDKTRVVDVNPTDTIEKVKAKIRDNEGLPRHQVKLLLRPAYRWFELKDGRSLKDCRIGHMSTLEVAVKWLSEQQMEGDLRLLRVELEDVQSQLAMAASQLGRQEELTAAVIEAMEKHLDEERAEHAKAEEESNKRRREKGIMSTCVVCYDAPLEVVLMPCRHLCLCNGCFEELKEHDGGRLLCPICRNQCDAKLSGPVYQHAFDPHT